ncbi:hypothetical protein OS493_012169 [Desmophyllum pertusum]|uniref:Granulins domain-containing protein n=1 Tax=Desmophyllum pertusum TaxID=174260 RepID=A0A9X0A3P3_9CNID|nr:hypothetical protein OS493_012169 [Desmophyllum pertusum]
MTFCLSFIFYAFLMASVSPVSAIDSVIPVGRICKPGPPLKASPGKMNCLVIGDSISIGYTPWVAKMLGDGYQVQHAPWDQRYGGALDSKHGLQCLRIFLQTVMLEPTEYDVIIFNFGLHDVNCCGNWPEEYTAPVDYAENLNAITSILLSTGAKLGYVLTTPVPYNVTLNNRVKQYNSIAGHVMKQYPTIATADLYTRVIDVCGDPPYVSCIIAGTQPSPHYTTHGYQYLSERIKDLILDLTQDIDKNLLSWKKQESLRWVASKYSVPCSDKSGKVVTMCPYNTTCCDDPFSSTGQGCCLIPKAIPCGDGMHCCPAGFECDPGCSKYKCSCRKKQ